MAVRVNICRQCGKLIREDDFFCSDLCEVGIRRMQADAGESPCPDSADGSKQHCQCWYEGEACCACKAPAMTEKKMREQGMIE